MKETTTAALNRTLASIGKHAGRVYALVPESRAEIRQLLDGLAQVLPQVDAAMYAAEMRKHLRKK